MQDTTSTAFNARRGDNLRQRMKAYALRVIHLYSALPHRGPSEVLGRQLLKSGTSVGAHYREACRARSSAEFISKIEGGLQELDESAYWLELLVDSQIAESSRLAPLCKETDELTAIFVASVRSAKRSNAPKTPPRRGGQK